MVSVDVERGDHPAAWHAFLSISKWQTAANENIKQVGLGGVAHRPGECQFAATAAMMSGHPLSCRQFVE
jgi:hypothetical protein